MDYAQIDSISYEENSSQNRNDYRTNGLGNLRYAMGNFRNDVYGDYIRYTHSSCHSYVVMSIDGKILVVNGANDSATKEIYPFTWHSLIRADFKWFLRAFSYIAA